MFIPYQLFQGLDVLSFVKLTLDYMSLVLYEPTAEQYVADIRSGGDPSSVDYIGIPALCNAIYEYRSLSSAKALLRDGADANKQTSIEGHLSVTSVERQKWYRNLRGNFSPLLIAIASGQPNMVKLLLNNGADPNAKTSKGFEPLLMLFQPYYMSVSTGKECEILKLMVQKGSDIASEMIVKGH